MLTVNHEEELEPAVRTSGTPTYSKSPTKSNKTSGNSSYATQQPTSNGSPEKVGIKEVRVNLTIGILHPASLVRHRPISL